MSQSSKHNKNSLTKHASIDMKTISEPNLVEITPRIKSKVKNTALIAGNNTQDLKIGSKWKVNWAQSGSMMNKYYNFNLI